MGSLDPKTKDVKLDFIFLHNGGLDDAFYCEDKPNEHNFKDNEKTRRLEN